MEFLVCSPIQGILYLGPYQTPYLLTSKSVDDLLNEIVRKGLSIEVSLILLSQYDLMNNNDTSIKDYLNTGKTDINLLISILSKMV